MSLSKSWILMWGILYSSDNFLAKWVFPARGGPVIKILIGLRWFTSQNSCFTSWMFLARPYSQCQVKSAGWASSWFSSVTIKGEGLRFRFKVRVPCCRPGRFKE